jgi:hypothetical protein
VGIARPVVSVSKLPWFIRYIHYFLNNMIIKVVLILAYVTVAHFGYPALILWFSFLLIWFSLVEK